MAETYRERFCCKNGLVVFIEVDDDQCEIRVYDENDGEVGKLEFFDVEGMGLKLKWAYLDRRNKDYLRQGIGRRCIAIMIERFGARVFAEDDDGIPKDDGSHLTGDAPAFVAQMRKEGLIAYSPHYLPDDDTDASL